MQYFGRFTLASGFLLGMVLGMANSTVTAAAPVEAGGAAPAKPGTLAPPLARKVPKEIVTHGDKRVDDYFWLREKTNADVIAYLQQENAYAEEMSRPQEPLRQ